MDREFIAAGHDRATGFELSTMSPKASTGASRTPAACHLLASRSYCSVATKKKYMAIMCGPLASDYSAAMSFVSANRAPTISIVSPSSRRVRPKSLTNSENSWANRSAGIEHMPSPLHH